MANEEDNVVVLTDKVTIESAAELAANLQGALVPDAAMTIDLSKVDTIDTAGFQVLIAAVNSSAAVGATIIWRGANGAVTELAKMADLFGVMKLDQQAAADEDDGLCPVY